MAGAFLSDSLRQQALAQVRGQMLQDEISRNTAQMLMGRVAPQLIGADLQREFTTGKARQQGAERKMRRDVGTTQLEMRKKLWHKEKVLGLIASVAEATGALGATMIGPDLEEGLPEAKMPTPEEMMAGGGMRGGDWGGMAGAELPSGGTVADVLEKAKYSEQIAGIPLERELSEAAGEYGGKEPIYGAFKEPVDTRVGHQKPTADRGDLDAVDEDDWEEYEQEKINRALAARLLETGPR